MVRSAMCPSQTLLVVMAITLAGCSAPGDPQARGPDNAASDSVDAGAVSAGGGAPAPDASPGRASANAASSPVTSAASADRTLLSCAADIGGAAADRLAKTCRNVSPATRPPCNVANSCAIMQDEIARSCALFDGKGEPMDGCGPDPKSVEAAADVVKRYYAALNARDYDTAWRQWGNDGPPNQTLDRFRAGFADTRSTQVTVGRLTPGDAGAGSVYQTVPVQVEAVLADGSHQRFAGNYVVRRVNDIDGSSADQRRWHIDSARLKATQ
jgi:hypothetical protein